MEYNDLLNIGKGSTVKFLGIKQDSDKDIKHIDRLVEGEIYTIDTINRKHEIIRLKEINSAHFKLNMFEVIGDRSFKSIVNNTVPDYNHLITIKDNDSSILIKYKKELARIFKQIDAGKRLGHNITTLKNKAKYYRRAIENLERNNKAINSLKPRTYYTIKVAHSGSNVVHGAILYTGFNIEDYPVTIYNDSYENRSEDYSIENIYYFEVLRELEEMNI